MAAAGGAMDMTLDDLIKSRKSTSGNFRGRGRGSAPGPTRRINSRAPNRIAPYTTAKAPDSTWQHDMFVDQPMVFPVQAVRAAGIETGTKLYISNLDYGVSNEDVKELFSEVGDLKRYAIHYDRSGRSKGTAEVVFSRRSDALAAVKRYNDVQLDGKPMKIELIGTNIPAPASYPAVDAFRIGNGFFGSIQASGSMVRRGRGGRGGRGFGRGRGRGRGRGGVSAQDLDAELENYHSEAMQPS